MKNRYKFLAQYLVILSMVLLNACSIVQQLGNLTPPPVATDSIAPVAQTAPVDLTPIKMVPRGITSVQMAPQNQTLVSTAPARQLNSKYYVVPVFYGTDRKPTGASDPSKYYGNNRNSNLELGIVKVSIPIIHASGNIESPEWWKFWNRSDTSKYMLLLDIKKMESDAYFKQLKVVVDASSDKDAFIFIHGFNNSFSDAAKRTAQLAFDLGINGAPIMYSWPSKGKVTEYMADENENLSTIPHLKLFLTQIVAKTQATRVNIIAHSMGNRALTQALKELSTENKAVHFNQIILAAPDIDAEIFKNDIAPYIKSTANRITMYSSSQDNALKLSKLVHGNYRAGDTDSKIITSTGIETIDASELQATDLLEHSYFSTDRPVINDMFMLLKFNVAPDSRNLLSIYQNDSIKYWTFKR